MGWKPIAHDKLFVAHCSLIYIYTPSAWIHFIPFIFAWVLIESEYLEVANVVSAHLLTTEIAQNIAKMTYISSTMACSLEKVTTSQGIVSIYFFRFSSKKNEWNNLTNYRAKKGGNIQNHLIYMCYKISLLQDRIREPLVGYHPE